MITEHAPLAASAAPQWGNCSGSVMAQMQIPDVEHPRTRAGTASHWVASEALINYRDTELGVACCDDYLGRKAPNGVVIDREMVEGAQVFVDHCLEITHKTLRRSDMLIEQPVSMPQIHQLNAGTFDFGLVQYADEWIDHGSNNASKQKIINIWLSDYKFGHRENKAFENLQLIDYAAGLIQKFDINGYDDQQIKIHMSIVQPFAYKAFGPVDTWSCTLSDLRPYFNQLNAKGREAFSNPMCSSGPWCRDCKAILKCDTAKRSNYSLIDYVNQPVVLDTYTASELGTEYAMLDSASKVLASRLDAIKSELEHQIAQGHTGSGYTLEASQGHLAYTCDNATAITVCNQFGVNIRKDDIITPTQAKARVPTDKKAAFEIALGQITQKPTRGLKLIPLKDSLTSLAFKKEK